MLQKEKRKKRKRTDPQTFTEQTSSLVTSGPLTSSVIPDGTSKLFSCEQDKNR